MVTFPVQIYKDRFDHRGVILQSKTQSKEKFSEK